MALPQSVTATTWLKKLNLVLLLAVIIMIANSAIHLVRLFLNDKPVPVQVATSSNQKNIPSLTPQAIAELHLFGKYGATATDDVSAPQASGFLSLKGVVVNDDTNSGAYISDHDQPEIFYKVNEELPGGASLSSVFADHVLIKRGSALETLAFPRDDAATNNAAAPSAGNADAANAGGGYAKFTTLPADESTALTKMSDQEIADKYKNKFKTAPEEAMKEIGLTAVAAGKSDGYKLTGEGLSAKFSGAGLKKDDVILSVNGEKIGNVDKDKSMIDKISLDKKPSIEIKRGDDIFVITYSPK